MTDLQVVDPALALDAQPVEEPAPERAIVCRRCSHAVTSEEARVARGGAHVHTRINPHGYVFQLGCFDRAEGCVAAGEATTEHTWFPGHAWRLAHCAACAQHLGWRFEGETGVFWGLILDRLVGG